MKQTRAILVAALSVTALSVTALSAQTTAGFEIASIRPHPAGDRNGALPSLLPGRRFKGASVPLNFVIGFAYNVPFQGQQLTGGPDWIRGPEGAYDIEAKAEPEALTALAGGAANAEDLAFADPARPTLFQIFDKLGLKMEQSRAAVESFVITSVEKPSEN